MAELEFGSGPVWKRAVGFGLLIVAVIGDLTGIFQVDKGHPALLLLVHLAAGLAVAGAFVFLAIDLLLRLLKHTYTFRSAAGPEETKDIDRLLKASYEGQLYPANEQIFPLLKKNRHCFKILECRSALSRLLNTDSAVGIVFVAPLTQTAVTKFLTNPSFSGLDLQPEDLLAPGQSCGGIYIGFTGIKGFRRNPRSREKRKHAEHLVRELRTLLLDTSEHCCFPFSSQPVLINRPITIHGINAALKGGFRNAFPFQLSALPDSAKPLTRLLGLFDRDSDWLRVNGWSHNAPLEDQQQYDHRDLADALMKFGMSFGWGPDCWKEAESTLTDAGVLHANYVKEFITPGQQTRKLSSLPKRPRARRTPSTRKVQEERVDPATK